MKKLLFFTLGMAFVIGMKAQELSVGLDFYNRYVFRGVDFGNSPSLQPSVTFTSGNFTLGAWGAYATTGDFSGEADLYASYAFDFGLSLGATSYYFPGPSWFELDEGVSSHAIELNLGYEVSNFSFAANYIVNDSRDGAGAEGGDTYFELGYGAGAFDLFVGAGDGWHTADGMYSDKGNFQVVNIGVGTSKDLQITETFAIPMSGSVILNPHTEQLHLVVGVSF